MLRSFAVFAAQDDVLNLSFLLDTLADLFNPLLALLALSVPMFEPKFSRRLAVVYLLTTAIGIAGIYAVGALDHKWAVWDRFDGDYSTHTAFATSLVVSIALWKRKWAQWLVVALLAYFILILILGYHTAIDVMTSAIVALGTTVPAQFMVRRSMAT